MKDAYIVEGVRTAIGGLGGSLMNETPDKLGAIVLKELIKRTKVNPLEIDEIIFGSAKQTPDYSNVARYISLKSNLPVEIPAYTIHRQCGSGLQSINSAAMQIQTENSEVIVAGGVESMSTAPYYVEGMRFGVKAGNVEFKDPNTASQKGSQPFEIYGDLNMGLTAENIAEDYEFSREVQDRLGYQSQLRAKKAIEDHLFEEEIVPYEIITKKAINIFKKDEHPRETNLELMAKLKPAFKKDGTVTAGNASGRNDGASAVLVVSKEKAKELGYKKAFKIVSFASAGVDPTRMGLGPISATRKALKKANLTIDDINTIELNEAFAAQALAFYKEFNIPIDSLKVNPNGGAIALGHPIGATGNILVTKIIHEMKRNNYEYGLITLCIAGGLGISTIIKYEDLV